VLQENPERFAAEIVDCLTQTTRPLGLLVGAGCPVAIKDAAGAPLIPDIAGMTTQVSGKIEKGPKGDAWRKVVKTFADDGIKNPNIEDILSRVRALRDVVGAGDARTLSSAELKDTEEQICSEIVALANKELPRTETPFSHMAQWLWGMPRQASAEVFTTNYDVLIEQALERQKVPYYDGFVGSLQPFFDSPGLRNQAIPKGWIRLWKLHGSINWKKVDDGGQLEICRTSPGAGAVIHPSHLKYDESRKMPYLALIDQLKAFMARPASVLLTSGYSFADQHLNEVLLEGLRANASCVVFGLLFGALKNYTKAIALAKKHPNFRIHAEDGAVVGQREVGWIVRDTGPGGTSPGACVVWDKKSVAGVDRFTPRFPIGDFNVLGEVFRTIATKQI
jgi:hypothetical protein